MIQAGTKLKVADNTGAKVIECFKVLGGTRRRYASLGDIIVASVKNAEPRRIVKNHEIVRAVVVRVKKPYRRADGSYVRFDDNAAVIVGLSPKGEEFLGLFRAKLKKRALIKSRHWRKKYYDIKERRQCTNNLGQRPGPQG